MKTDKYELRIKSLEGFIDISSELAEHVERWLKETNKLDKIDVEADFIGEEDET